MPYALLDDKFHSHGKTVAAGLAGAGLYTRALSRCADYLTDGWVPLGWAREIATSGVRKKVTDAAFWIEVEGDETFEYVKDDAPYTVTIPGPGFFIPDYLEFNPSRGEVELKRSELSKKRSEAGKKGALIRWQRQRQTDSNGDGNALANDRQTDGPLPLPLKSTRAVPVARPDEQRPSVKETIERSLREAS